MDMTLPPLAAASVTEVDRTLLRSLARALSADQALWVSGYFAGVAEARGDFAGATGSTPTAAVAVAGPAGVANLPSTIKILYASETGNAAALSRDIASRAQQRGLSATVEDLARYKTRELVNERTLLFVSSTHGEGDAPEPAQSFFEFLAGRRAPRLEQLRFAVLALGDSTYELYCHAGKTLDQRLEELGGTRLVARVDCDVDYEEAASAWIETFLSQLQAQTPGGAVSATGVAPASVAQLSVGPTSVVQAHTDTLVARTLAQAANAYGKQRPFPALVSAHLRVTGRGSSKDTRHIEFSLEGSGLQYTPGDALGVVPQNDPALVAQLIERGGWSGTEPVTTRAGQQTLQQALQSSVEIAALTPHLIEQWAAWSDTKALAQQSGSQRSAFMGETQLLDLFQQHPLSGALAAQDFVTALRSLQPRLYSIASASALVGDEVHVCVAPVRYDLNGHARTGVASGYLADRLELDQSVPVYIQSNEHFRLPAEADTPIIMIGAGTGVAPYRAFMQQREALGVSERSWLFFGERRFRTDFLYQLEWQEWLRGGQLTRADLAFSRDQHDKIYVQHKLQQQAAELYRWIADGAHLYVCGDAEHMAADVHQALLSVVEQQGGRSRDGAQEFLLELQSAGRYQKDVY